MRFRPISLFFRPASGNGWGVEPWTGRGWDGKDGETNRNDHGLGTDWKRSGNGTEPELEPGTRTNGRTKRTGILLFVRACSVYLSILSIYLVQIRNICPSNDLSITLDRLISYRPHYIAY